MCPLTCEVVKEAIKVHEERGVIMGMYVDEKKRIDERCQLCARNEKATSTTKAVMEWEHE